MVYALIIPQPRFEEILKLINDNLQTIQRIGTYANAKSILRKSVDELKKLRDLGLKIIYLGVETGNVELLQKIKKGVTYEQMVEAARRGQRGRNNAFCNRSIGIGWYLRKASNMQLIRQKF